MVIASLVRSNERGSIGFLGAPQRINVLFSRARHGLILLGNTQTLRNAWKPSERRHWVVKLDLLEQQGSILTGLPAVCQMHGFVHTPLLDCPAAFRKRSPNGGCTKPCGHKMTCGHQCPMKCHAFDREHTAVSCKVMVIKSCEAGHKNKQACSDPASCRRCKEVRRTWVASILCSFFFFFS